MLATYLDDGSTINYTPEAAVEGGDVIILGSLIGIAAAAIAAAALGTLYVRGKFRVAKADSEVITQGELIFWDPDNEEATGTDTGYVLGRAAAESAAAETTVDVLLNQPDVLGT